MPLSRSKKQAYFAKAAELFRTHDRVMLSYIDNIGSSQLNEVRHALRGHAVMLKSKNTFIKHVIKNELSDMEQLQELVPHFVGNLCIFFTNKEFSDIAEIINANKRCAAAKIGQVAPIDVEIPAMVTQLDPSQSSFFLSLNIPTKLNRGRVEILRRMKIITKGEKVSSSQTALLEKLEIMPFFYQIELTQLYDQGDIFPATVLDISEKDVEDKVKAAIATFTGLSIGAGYPTLPAVPHIFAAGMRRLLGFGLTVEHECPELEGVKAFLADPSAFAAAAPAEAAADAGAAEEEPESEPESEEESESDFGFGGLF